MRFERLLLNLPYGVLRCNNTRIDFAGPYAFLRPDHFDAYSPHTGPFSLMFSEEIARRIVRVK